MNDGKARAPDGWWTASEAIAWVAFGQPVEFANWSTLPGMGRSRAWGGPEKDLLAAMEARAENRVWKPARTPISGAEHCSANVWRLMRETGLSAAALAEDLRRDLARDAECLARWERAQDELRAALASGRLRCWGQATAAYSEPPLSDELVPVPAEVFAGPSALTVQPNGWTYPPDLGRPYRGRWWQGVCVRAAELSAALPAPQRDRETRVPPPALAELPTWWTLDQTIAWIALRDTAAVRDSGPQEHGRDTRGVTGWHVEWVWRKAEGEAVGPDPTAAATALRDLGRRGVLRARGRANVAAEPQEIGPADWALVTIAEDLRHSGARHLLPVGMTGIVWRDVLVAQEDAVREWRPFEAAPPAAAEAKALPTPPKRHVGGRPERKDWPMFTREVTRRLALDGADLTLTDFKREMKKWAAGNMAPVPDDRTIDRRIDRDVPSDIFVPG